MAEKLNIVGKTFAGYAVEKKVGSGGMGVVFRAKDARLGRVVALKILPPNLLKDDLTRQRFIREGRTAAKVEHEHVVRVLAAGEEAGYPYLIMEYVEGGSLQARIDRYKNLPVAEAISITRQVAAGLGAAHRAGIFHRDVKPANVLFTLEGEAKLADFGLAKEERADVSLSVTGMVMGTPHYMAPEVCEGKKGDARSDLYALGVMLYYMIGGRFPFDGSAVMEVLMAHVTEVAPPLEEAPPAVAEIIDRLMAKDPAERFQSSDELVVALKEASRDPKRSGGVSGSGVRAASGSGAQAVPGSGVRAAAPGSGVRAAVPGSGVRAAVPGSGASPTPGGATPSPTMSASPLSLSMVGPLPKSHVFAYAVAGVTLLVCAVLLTWAFGFQGKGGGPGGTGTAGAGPGKVEVPVDPDVIRSGEEFQRWQAFVARARQPGADPRAMLAEMEKHKAPEKDLEDVRAELHERLRLELASELFAREKALLELVEKDPTRALDEAKARGDWGAYPFRRELEQLEIQRDSRVWDAFLAKVRREATELERSGEWALATEKWEKVRTPHPDKRETVRAETIGVHQRARLAAEDADRTAPAGEAGAKALRALAKKMPQDLAKMLEDAAFMRERTSGSENPLDDLAGLVLLRDFGAIRRQLDHLEKTAGSDKAKLATARRLTDSCAQVIAHALEEYRRLSEKPVEIERQDGSIVKGTMFEVSDEGDQVTLATSGVRKDLKLGDLSSRELVARSLGPWPGDDRLENALDFALVTRDPVLSNELGRRLARRGRSIGPLQAQWIEKLAGAEAMSEARELMKSIEATVATDPRGAGPLARRMLDRFGHWPVNPAERSLIRRALALGSDGLDPRDLERAFDARLATGADGAVTFDWSGGDAWLEDFGPGGHVSAQGGEGLTVTPRESYASLILEGIEFRSVKLRMVLKPGRDTFVIACVGARNIFDAIPCTLVLNAQPATSRATLPLGDDIVEIGSTEDGWYEVEISLAETAYQLTVNGKVTKQKLPAAWAGSVSLLFNGPVVVRELSVTGKPAWMSAEREEGLRAAQEAWARHGRDLAESPIGAWKKAGAKEKELALDGQEEEQSIRPAKWAHGTDYMLRFGARLDGRGTREAYPQFLLDLRTGGKTVRRVALAGESRAGFLFGAQWMRTGTAARMELGEWHEFEVVVRGETAVVLMDGRTAWVGSVGLCPTGGPALSVRHGTLTVRDLHSGPVPR